MNRLVIIGNGFDLAHGLYTKYTDFMAWFWMDIIQAGVVDSDISSINSMCTLENGNFQPPKSVLLYQRRKHLNLLGQQMKRHIQNKPNSYPVHGNVWIRICENIETKGWTDLESDYYLCLTRAVTNCRDLGKNSITDLNGQFNLIRKYLIEYLKIVGQIKVERIDSIYDKIYRPILKGEIDNSYYFDIPSSDETIPSNILLLNFNYTRTPELYFHEGAQVTLNYIHGKLDNPGSIILGYGDESDENYKTLRGFDDDGCLKYHKQLHYLEYENYRNLTDFLDAAPFQICIMGHSCGKSDLTLLKELFEHHNCISIKPYYFKPKDGEDNYSYLTNNINRIFTDSSSMRRKVVIKERTEPLTK